MKASVFYEPDLLRPEAADLIFKRLWSELDWVRHPGVPRREYYLAANDQPYTYGRGAGVRTYHSQASHEDISMIWLLLQVITNVKYDVVFLNGYEDGSDHLGWHSDDSPEMDDTRPIAIVTLGQARDIWFRKKPLPGIKTQPGFSVNFGDDYEALKLEHGSLALMAPGMQDTHQHRIPKAGFQPCGPRISLTFRGIAS